MPIKLFKTTIYEDIVVIDSQFPQKEPFGFRNAEVNEYLKRIKNFSTYTMYPMAPGPEAWFDHGYGVDYKSFKENKRGYLQHYPENKKRIRYLDKNRKYKIKLAYSYFLGETYVLLPFFEKNKIPFVFVLYPGGCFALNNKKSDQMINRICQSELCMSVIVTQRLTKNYLLAQNLCPADKITYIYGFFTQFDKSDVKPKRHYKKNKQTFDICFVAAKYTEKGVDKGYDLFIEVAKKLCKVTDDVMFHVVGGFNEDDIDVEEIKSRIRFYGYKRPDFFCEFYANMDIFLSPNRPYKIFPGNFDGFPLGVDASYCGTALFVSDELKMNQHYTDGKDIVIIPLDANRITRRIIEYRNNADKLYDISAKGQTKTQKLFDMSYQIDQRMDLFNKYVELEVM